MYFLLGLVRMEENNKMKHTHFYVVGLNYKKADAETREVEVMVTGILMAAGFCVYIAATWMYGQKEDQAWA